MTEQELREMSNEDLLRDFSKSMIEYGRRGEYFTELDLRYSELLRRLEAYNEEERSHDQKI